MPQTLTEQVETQTFERDHVLFSRTSSSGIIRSCNQLFQEVSGYSTDDLIGAPQKIVRNPAMPRAAFQLLWDHIKAGQPLGQYVVNQSKSGEAYTVFAVAMPYADGYVSLRLKPAPVLTKKLKKVYDTIAAREAEEGLTPDVSRRELEQAVTELGYADYASFMADALEFETLQRAADIGEPPPRDVTVLAALQKAVETVLQVGQALDVLMVETNQIPDNMRLQAKRLEGREGPIGIISANYQQMTETFSASIASFLTEAEAAVVPLRDARFLAATSVLLGGVATQLGSEAARSEERRDVDLTAISDLIADYTAQTEQAVAGVARRGTYFGRVCKDMRRLVFGLEMTRTMCNIERSKTSANTDALNGVVDRLKTAEVNLSQLMSQFEGAIHDIMDRSNVLLNNRAKSDVPAETPPDVIAAQ